MSSVENVQYHSKAELRAALRDLPVCAWYSINNPMPPGQHEGFMLRLQIMDCLQDE